MRVYSMCGISGICANAEVIVVKGLTEGVPITSVASRELGAVLKPGRSDHVHQPILLAASGGGLFLKPA
jgi:hypothetical protein